MGLFSNYCTLTILDAKQANKPLNDAFQEEALILHKLWAIYSHQTTDLKALASHLHNKILHS